MRTVAQIFQRKGHYNVTISPEVTVFEALKIMAQKNIGSVIIKDHDGKYYGLMTERDYARKVILQGKSSSDTPVGEIMSEYLPQVTPDSGIDECMSIMTAHNLRYLPVFLDGEFYGVISVTDIVKETILEQQETIGHLENYIHSM